MKIAWVDKAPAPAPEREARARDAVDRTTWRRPETVSGQRRLPPGLREALARSHAPGLDGLRMVAVFLVVFYHFGFQAVPGGHGVLGFFVLSGFLITWLLLKEQERFGSISLRLFYLRRLLRIVPAFLCFWLIWTAALVLTGKRPTVLDPTSQSKSEHPDFGSVASKLRGLGAEAMPPFVGLSPKMITNTWAIVGEPGFLGRKYSAFKPNAEGMGSMVLKGMTLDQLGDRKRLMKSFDGLRRDLDTPALNQLLFNLRHRRPRRRC